MNSILITVFLLACVLSSGICRGGEPAGSVVVRVKKNNAAAQWTEEKTTLLKHLDGFDPRPVGLSRYGGRTDRREEATGFFHASKTGTGWILVDPEGCQYLSVGVCSTSPNDQVADTKQAFAETFAGRNDWARKTRGLLVDEMKFNGSGAGPTGAASSRPGAECPTSGVGT